MSRAFGRFLSELRAQWPEKKDGFDPATLKRLSGAERKEALGLLRQAVDDGDDTAVEALVLLDPVAGPSFLRESLRTNPHEMVRVRIVATPLAAGSLTGLRSRSLI